MGRSVAVWLFLATTACAGQQTEDARPKPSADAGVDAAQDGPTGIADSGIFPSTDGGPCQAGATGACYTGPPATRNIGVCKDGTTTCDKGEWQACVGDTLPGTEVCNEIDDDCDGTVDEGCSCVSGTTRACYSGPSGTEGNGGCKGGTQNCAGGSWETLCVGESLPKVESCNGQDDDCDGNLDNGNPGGGASCTTGQPGVCKDGTMRCSAGKVSCQPNTPASSEQCNLLDDNCNGSCDESAGCRIGVHRSLNSGISAHFYTTSLSEASSSGYTIEYQNFYYLYKTALTGMTSFYRCLKANGKHFYTAASNCEGGGTSEGAMGFIGTASTGCQSTPLYRLYHSGVGDHFYTTTTSERDYAVSIGYKYESIAGYVWTAP
ncbi:MAG: MopE-related protein [Polyangiaceae bacterium]